MKIFYIFIFILFLITPQLFSQPWQVLSQTPSSRLDCFYVLQDGLHGMAVGENFSLTTSNGGVNWVPVTSIPNAVPNKLSMVSASLAWVVCNEGKIFRTTDGGQTWVQQSSGTTRKLQDVQFIDQLNGWVVGGTSSDGTTLLVLRTTNGGQTWVDLSFGSNCQSVEAGRFINAQTGWICGRTNSEPTIHKTVDGGNNWVSQVLPPAFMGSGKKCSDIGFASADIGWATTDRNNQDGEVIYTTNGGATWTIQTYTFRDINCIAVKNSLQVAILGWKVGSNTLMIVKTTSNGGLTWATNNVPISSSTYSLSYVGSSIWLGSMWSRILHSTDLGVSWEYQYASHYLQSVDWINDNNAWITSRSLDVNGFTLRTSNSGNNWINAVNTPGGNDVFVYDENSAWIMIEGSPYTGPGILFRTTNGGVNWDTTTLAAGYISSIYFITASTGWVYGGGGNIRKTVDGGINWSSQNCITGLFISDVHFINTMEGWACGGYGTGNGFIRHTTDGGANWTIQNPASTNFLSDIQFFDASNGLAIANGGLVQSTSNGGATWSTISTIPLANLDGLLMLNSDTGWVIGRNPGGHIYRTDNGGHNWTAEWSATLPGQSLSKIVLNPSGTCILGCGINNTIVRRTLLVNVKEEKTFCESFFLSQNFPNPFNPSTIIRYALPRKSFVTLTVYNTLGLQVAQLVNEQQPAGYHDVVFRGVGLVSGVYFYKLETDGYVNVKKMLLVK
ncbi:YCF48-related protein [Bacteroidota bacterium]